MIGTICRRLTHKKIATLTTVLLWGVLAGSISGALGAEASKPAKKTTQEEPGLPMTLLSPSDKSLDVFVSLQATASEKLAARELSDYLEKITGKPINIRLPRKKWDTDNPPGKYIVVGHSDLTDDINITALSHEQYIIDINANRIAIIGGRDRQRGVLYGVYDFLEQLGVRWYRPEPWGEYVPSLTKLEFVTGKTISKRPTYEFRSVISGGFTRIGEHTLTQREWGMRWALRNRLNGSDVGGEPAHGGQFRPVSSHSYFQRVPVETYFAEHPEYFNLYQGQRRKVRPDFKTRPGNPTGLQLCLSNPAVQEIFAQSIIAEARAAKDFQSTSFSATPNDAGPFCECDQCRAMDDPKNPRMMSNRVCKFTNIVARKVAKAVPGAMVSLNAYSSWADPPTVVEKMEPNVIIHTALINELSDYTKMLEAPAPNWNLKTLANFQKWHALGIKRVYTYDYWSGYGWKGPLPIARTIANRLKSYRKFGIRGTYDETSPSWGSQGFELYIAAKLLWNPDLDIEKELNIYYENYFGPAAKPMKAYHEALMKALEEHPFPVTSGGRGMHLVFTPKLVQDLGIQMKEAQEKVKDAPLYRRRLHGIWAGYEVARRISEILAIKMGPGSEEVEVTRGAHKWVYLKNPAADKAYADLIRWMHSIDKVGEDAVFDMYADTPYIPYLSEDVLENGAMGFASGDEAKILSKMGFSATKTN